MDCVPVLPAPSLGSQSIVSALRPKVAGLMAVSDTCAPEKLDTREGRRCSNVLLMLRHPLSLQESRVTRSLTVVLAIVGDLMAMLFRSRAAVIAENLFLRRQLALYLERQTRRCRPSPVTKFALVPTLRSGTALPIAWSDSL